MRTREDWPRADFLAWLDGEKARLGVRSDLALADMAGISHTSISGWRTGRQRPSMESLTALARALGAEPRDLWVRAGLVDPARVGLSEQSQMSGAVDIDEDEESIRIIAASDAPDEVKEELIREIRRMQREAAAERVNWAQRFLEMARRVRGAT